MYMPTLGRTAYSGTGRVAASVVNALASATQTLVEGLASAQFIVVVPTTTQSSGKAPNVVTSPMRTLQGMSAVRVDDVGDIIRRRRYRKPSLVVTHPLALQTLPAPESDAA